MREYELRVVDDLAGIATADWNCRHAGNPSLRHAFLQGMIDAGGPTAASGWLPQFLTLWREIEGRQTLAGAVPLYMKGHSYGEYVFDWSWAEAYQRAGLDYYPKLLAAVPFTPCTGARLMAHTDADRRLLIDGLLAPARQSGGSSLHVLFPEETEHQMLIDAGMMARTAVQFHWRNAVGAGYGNFDAFLATMSHDKRKKVKQERRKVQEAGIRFVRKPGSKIDQADWNFFHSTHTHTS